MIHYRKLKRTLEEGDADERVEEPLDTEIIDEEMEHKDSEGSNTVV